MTIFGYTLPQLRKSLVALAGMLATLLASNLLPGSWAHWVGIAIGILTVVGTYGVRNADAPPKPRTVGSGRHEASNPPTPEVNSNVH